MTEKFERIAQLIVDMTFGGATREELERAVEHSLDILDAEKAIEKSEIDNNIVELLDKYSAVSSVSDEVFEKYISGGKNENGDC